MKERKSSAESNRKTLTSLLRKTAESEDGLRKERQSVSKFVQSLHGKSFD